MNKISVELIPTFREIAIDQAMVNVERLNKSIDLGKFEAAFNRVIGLNVSQRAKMERFLDVASDLSQAVRPFTACKSGCSHCCNIAATITGTEAQIIGKAIGRKPKKLVDGVDYEETRDKWFGVPCTFLKRGRCSIYEVRPLACRLHVSLADNPSFCEIEVPSGESIVPQINLDQINLAHAQIFHGDVWADVRDFFPPKD